MIDNDDNDIKKISTDNYAVAISYEKKTDNAPKVLAKGGGHIANKIIDLAQQKGIEVKEDKDLIQILKTVDIDEQIPLEAFNAVAEILGYIYKQNANQQS